MGCPHTFATLDVEHGVFAAIDWSTAAQQLYCRVITSQGHYGVLRRGSPNRTRMLLTPHGVLQVCLLYTLPFATRDDTRIRTMRDARHTRQCTERPELVASLAEALLAYDQARAQVVQLIKQRQRHALHALEEVVIPTVQLVNRLRRAQQSPQQGKRLPHTTTLARSLAEVRRTLEALPDPETLHQLLDRNRAVTRVTRLLPWGLLLQRMVRALTRHVPRMRQEEAWQVSAALLYHFALLPAGRLPTQATRLRKELARARTHFPFLLKL